MPRERWDTVTISEYWERNGPRPVGPTPWWLLTNQPPPAPSRRLVRQSRGDGQEASEHPVDAPPRRRRLVRVGARAEEQRERG
jgi:hypothetical protein